MAAAPAATELTLPRSWSKSVKSAMLHAVALAHYAIMHARGNATNDQGERRAVEDRLAQEASLLAEETCIKDARMARLSPQRRPHYQPTERLAILELRAVRGWSLETTAERFLVTLDTIASWQRRVDEDSPGALVQLPQPVN